VSHELFCFFLVAIGAVATRPEVFFTKETFAIADSERDRSQPDTLTVGAPWRLPSSAPGNASAISRTTLKFIFVRGMDASCFA
jgi:hypothetical protein